MTFTITAVITSLVFVAIGLFVIAYFEKKRQKEIEADIKRHEREMIDLSLDDFERKIS